MTVQDAGREPIPQRKLRAVETNVRTKAETYLGDFNSFSLAEEQIKLRFKNQGMGWYTYAIYNASGKQLYIATTTKRKEKFLWIFTVTKTTFVSERY